MYSLFKKEDSWVVVAHAFNPSTWEAEAGRYLWFQGKPGLQSEFQDRLQSYRETLSWKTETQKKRKEDNQFAWGGNMTPYSSGLQFTPQQLVQPLYKASAQTGLSQTWELCF